jgi:transcription elongation factor Elf1
MKQKAPCPKCNSTASAKIKKINGEIASIVCKKCGYKLEFIKAKD